MARSLAVLLISLALTGATLIAWPSTLPLPLKIQFPNIPRVHAAPTATLFGRINLPSGWGNTSATVTSPGPTLTLIQGSSVMFTLNSADGAPHNWGIDYNGNLSCDAGEPCTATFTTSQTISFTITSNPGNYTYWCFVHHGPMFGKIIVKSAFSLFGNAATGWGASSTTITTPGPTLSAFPGTIVTMTLTSSDGFQHNWGVDYNGDGVCGAGEPCSPLFGSPSPATRSFTFTATTIPGNYTYYCFIHFAPMIGKFIIRFPHDVGVSILKTSRTSAYNSVTIVNPIQVNVTAQNLGANAETFAVYAKANTTLIGNKTITLTSGQATIVRFNWTNTGSLTRGTYILTANATRVMSETIFTNNQLTGSNFAVRLK